MLLANLDGCVYKKLTLVDDFLVGFFLSVSSSSADDDLAISHSAGVIEGVGFLALSAQNEFLFIELAS